MSPSDRDFDLIVVGDCNPDVIVTGDDLAPEFGQAEKLVAGMSLVIGGSASITAVAAARLGLRTALVAAVGDDPAADLIITLLCREGVDTAAVARRPGLSTPMTAVFSRQADRAILTAPGAMTTITAADVPASLVARARHLHVSAYFLVAGSLGPGLAGLLASARRHGLGTSLDTNYDPAGRWRDQWLPAALSHVGLFLPNQAEARGITGQHDPAAAALALAAAGPDVAVKLGARGALCVAAGDGRPWLVSVPERQPADTTGAGDCFNAGVIAGLLAGLDLPGSVAVGCAAGAESTAGLGGTGARVDRETAFRLAAAATIRQAASAP